MLDFATNRARLEFDDPKTVRNLALLFGLNVCLTIITLFNIKQERQENVLIQEDIKRVQEEKERL